MIVGTTRSLAVSMFAATLATAQAADIEWDSTRYLKVPVKLGSDTRLVMPEAFDDSWEHDEQISATLLDAQTLIIRPRTSKVEQRLTLRGRSSGTLYLARVSSALPFSPMVVVHAPTVTSGSSEPSGKPSITALLRAMLLGVAPPGFRVETSSRVLLDQAPYRVVAEQLWRSFNQAGLIARVTSTLPQHTIPIVPANIQIHIPQLGALRAMAADDYELAPGQTSSHIYIVYGRY